MYFSLGQIEKSLNRLRQVHPFFGMSFLAFKKAGLTVGEMEVVTFSNIAEDILTRYYRPCSAFSGFYNPFQTSDTTKRWQTPRYGSTSLQRITTDTFSDAFLHEKNTSLWGWHKNYIGRLKTHLRGRDIPAFDLAVWLFRDTDWPQGTSPTDVRNKLFLKFHMEKSEVRALFDNKGAQLSTDWLVLNPVSEGELLGVIGSPPGLLPEGGAALLYLSLKHVGPVANLTYEPAERLNIITGDNSLGKTFILECVWWALTGHWLEDNQAIPRKDVGKRTPEIIFGVTTGRNRPQEFCKSFDWDAQRWVPRTSSRETMPGLVIYARYDGSFAVWDPVRSFVSTQQVAPDSRTHLFFRRNDIWNGLTGRDGTTWLCNGLIRDWVSWQMSGDRFQKQYKALVSSLKTLSPSQVEVLKPGDPTRLAFDVRDIPTLCMPYGCVPITHTSAGVQRVMALAYILVWTWYEHVASCSVARKDPQKKLVLMVDEVEAHLHPRWQRVIVPAIIDVIAQLSSEVKPQVHLATHSPMVMASAEVVFDEALDNLHHLDLKGSEVILKILRFVKRGRADLWLNSEVFGLKHARSLEGERVIEAALELQRQQSPDSGEVRRVNGELIRFLAQDDDFWPRWRFFAKQHGLVK